MFNAERISFSPLAAAADVGCQLLDLHLLQLLAADLPVVVLVEESEHCARVWQLLLQGLVGDVELSPVDLSIPVQVVCRHQLLLDGCLLQVLQVLGVSESGHISHARL